MREMIISSPQFTNNDWMPDSLSGYGEDKSPEFHIEYIPDGTITLAIIMDDLDHPIRPGFNHWIAWNISPNNQIPGALPKGEIIEKPIYMEQGIGYGKHCYRGPKPPFNWCHRYIFTIYALDIRLRLETKSKKSDLIKNIKNHILAKGELIGRYQRKHG